MKAIAISLFLFLAQMVFAQTYNGPESAEYDYANSRWLISNTSSHQVLARNASGVLTVFVSNTTSGPYGIEIVGDTLFCCCGTSIKGYLLSTAALVFNVNIGATFLNGLTHDNTGNLITTDFTAKNIFKINITSQAFTSIASALSQSPNGIVFDAANNRCVFVSWGANAPVKAIDMNTNAVSTIVPTTMSNCDGITRDGLGRYYISTWGTQSVVRYDSAFLAPSVSVVPGLSNPADIFYNVVSDTLAIPNAGNNTVTFVGFTSTVAVPELLTIAKAELYPNPVIDESKLELKFIHSGSANIQLLDLQGKIVKEWYFDKIKAGEETTLPVHAKEFAQGTYLIRINSGSQQQSLKLQIQ